MKKQGTKGIDTLFAGKITSQIFVLTVLQGRTSRRVPFSSPSPKGDMVLGSLENWDGFFVSFSLLIHETPQKPPMILWEQGERDYVHLISGERVSKGETLVPQGGCRAGDCTCTPDLQPVFLTQRYLWPFHGGRAQAVPLFLLLVLIMGI